MDNAGAELSESQQHVRPPSSGVMQRRVTRDASGSGLVEDLWISCRAPARPIHRQFVTPRDVLVVVDVVDDSNGEVAREVLEWEDQLVAAADATQYRAMAARLNYLAFGRADVAVRVQRSSSTPGYANQGRHGIGQAHW